MRCSERLPCRALSCTRPPSPVTWPPHYLRLAACDMASIRMDLEQKMARHRFGIALLPVSDINLR